MAAWLDREGFDSRWLRWMVDYACRDDYGALSGDVSAWAGIHYFAARDAEEDGPLTWPEGNGWIVRRLLERLGPAVRPRSMVHRIERRRHGLAGAHVRHDVDRRGGDRRGAAAWSPRGSSKGCGPRISSTRRG